jgi:hypothetical protein
LNMHGRRHQQRQSPNIAAALHLIFLCSHVPCLALPGTSSCPPAPCYLQPG